MASNALAMALGTMLSRALGLFRELALAALFDKTVTDAWITAFRLPNLFRRLLGEGALTVSFIPVFIEARVKDPTLAKSKNLVNGFYALLWLVLLSITFMGILFPEILLKPLLDPQYQEIPGKMELTLKMTRIMFVFVLMVSQFAFFMGVLNALGRFSLPALAPMFFNIALIASTLMPQEWWSWPGQGLAWGVVVGGFLQMAVLYPSLLHLGYAPKIVFQWNPEIKKVLKNMVPGLLGMGLMQLSTLVNLRFASQLAEGSISYINYADRLLELPLSLISVSLGTALLPMLSEYKTRGQVDQMLKAGHFYLRMNLFISIPAALGLFFLAEPIIGILFQRGHFSELDTLQTAGVLQVYAFTLLTASSVRVMVPNFYAVKNTWFPALASGISLVVHIAMAPLLMRQWGLYGLNTSSLLSTAMNLGLLFVGYHHWVGSWDWKLFLKSLFKFLLAGSGLILGLQIYPFLLGWIGEELGGISGGWGGFSFLGKLFSLLAAIMSGGAMYFLVGYLLKAEELLFFLRRWMKK